MEKKTIKDVLRQLMTQHKISENELAKRTSLNQPTVHRLLAGETADPRASTLIPIARYFDISLEALLGEEELAAPKLNPTLENTQPIRYAPILSWDEAKSICITGSNPPEKDKKKPIFSDAGYRAFWLQMRGNAMYPYLRDKESFLCVDPDKTPIHGALCLVLQKDLDELMVRMILLDGSLKVIKTVHPDFYFREHLDNRFQYCGLVTEDQHAYTN